MLINSVKTQTAIWDLSSKDHCNAFALTSAWEKISTDMSKPVDECKAAWKSIKDSQRYQKKSAGKSGSSLEEADDCLFIAEETINNDADNLEATQMLSFITPASERRRTISSNSLVDEHQDELYTGGESSSNYSLGNTKKKAKIADSASHLADSIKEYIALKKASTAAPQNQLKHFSMLANLDRMLQRLPDDIVESLNVTFVNFTYEKIKEYENKTNN